MTAWPLTVELLVAAGSVLWVALILAPWRPCSTRERLEPLHQAGETDLSDVTVLIPARNEGFIIERTLSVLRREGNGLRVILIDDQSSDETASIASSRLPNQNRCLFGSFLMTLSYLPILRYYRRSILWAPTLPLISCLYLLMTWPSAVRYWRGKRSKWKGRVYAKEGERRRLRSVRR